MVNPWEWLRHRTSTAVMDGFADALDRIDRGDVARLQERLTLALASPQDPGDVSPAAASDATARTGKRGAK